AKIQTNHVSTSSSQGECDVSRAAANVKCVFARLNIGHADQLPLPPSVQAKTLDVINQVVARGHGGKEPIHLRRAFLTRTVELIPHVRQWRPDTEQTRTGFLLNSILF